tara:strand:+ start:172 stop:291 length:120 start_codon:yes stop_codon:yes gene_type:complete
MKVIKFIILMIYMEISFLRKKYMAKIKGSIKVLSYQAAV